MKLKTIHELDFAAQRTIVGGGVIGPCRCACNCDCSCVEDDLYASIRMDNNKFVDNCKTTVNFKKLTSEL